MTTGAGSQGAAGGAPQGQAPAAGVILGTPAAVAGAGEGQGQSGSPGSGAGAGEGKAWWDGLVKDADNLTTFKAKNWADGDAMAKSYRELETKVSQGVKALAPADPKEYAFTVPDEIKDTYNSAFAETYRGLAHKAGLSKEQAAAIHDGVLEFSQQSAKAAQADALKALEKSVTAAKGALEEAWGSEKSPEFARNIEMSRRAISQLDPDFKNALVELGAIVKTASGETIANASIFKALAKAGASMFAEDGLFGTQAANTNPFAKETENATAQGRLFRENPDKAKLLIRALPAAEQQKWSWYLNQ